MIVGEISHLPHNEGYYYMAPGPIILCIIYFVYRKEWSRRNGDSDKVKVLTRTWDNKFDWWTILVCTGGAVF